MKKLTTLVACLSLAIAAVSAASGSVCIVHHTESFEGAVGTTYELSAVFDDGGFDYFGRYAVPDNTNDARDDFQNGWDLEFGIHGQDHDGDGEAATQTITIDNININGLTNINVIGAFGAQNSEPTFDNYEAADGDGMKIYVTIDAGARVQIGEFAPPALGGAGGAGAGDLYQDTNLDGVGDGLGLTVDLADFTFAVAGNGLSLKIEIECTSTDSFEPLAIDNIRVCGDGAVQVEGTTWSRIKSIYR